MDPVPHQHPVPAETAAEHAATMRGRIIDGAERAFAEHGYRGANVPAIAAAAGVSVGLIYRYFASKEELFLSVCQDSTESRLDELAVALGAIADPGARLEAAVDRFVESLVEGHWGTIVVHAWPEAEANPRIRDMLQRLFEQIRGFAAHYLREAIARGELPAETDVDATATGIAMLLHGAIALQAERGPAFDPAATRRAILALLSLRLDSR